MAISRQTKRRALIFTSLFNVLSNLSSVGAVSLNMNTRSLKFSESPNDSKHQTPAGLYVHIPYCRRRCRYCDFAIVPIGSSASENLDDRATRGFLQMDHIYRQAVLDEFDLVQNHAGTELVPIQSIYFGGGTPSLAPVDTIAAIMKQIRSSARFNLAENAEITMEMDPGTFGLEKLRALKDLGVNRISLGVQSFDNVILEEIGRVHRSDDISKSLEMLQEVFGESPNYSIDLISGLPGVTLAKWIETLEQASKLSPKPTHLSLYDLQIEAGTIFDKWYGEAKEQTPTVSSSATFLPSPSDCAFMYKYASGFLKQFGYQHYEISSYSLSDYRSRHNQIYWHPGATWYAVGLGATSSVNGARFSRPRAMQDYVDWVKEQKEKTMPDWLVDEHDMKELDRLTDVVMTRLRTSDGLDLDFVEQEYGQAKVDGILRGAQLGLDLELAHQLLSKDADKRGILRLKDPEGFLFSNSIISSIFVELGVEM